jgi:hypothetical protein
MFVFERTGERPLTTGDANVHYMAECGLALNPRGTDIPVIVLPPRTAGMAEDRALALCDWMAGEWSRRVNVRATTRVNGC